MDSVQFGNVTGQGCRKGVADIVDKVRQNEKSVYWVSGSDEQYTELDHLAEDMWMMQGSFILPLFVQH